MTNSNAVPVPAPRMLLDGSSDEAEMIIAERVQDAQVSFREVMMSDWSNTLCAAPQAIGILGECMLVSSMSAAKRVTLDSSELRAKRLTTNLLNIYQIGQKTFMDAQIRMATISTYSNQIGMPNGTLDKITMRMGRAKTPLNQKNLANDLKNLKLKTNKSALEANAILVSFEEWRDAINTLWLAVEEKHGENLEARAKLKEKAEELKKDTETKKEKQAEARRLFQIQERKLKEAMEYKRKKDNWIEQDNGKTVGLGIALSLINPALGWGLAGLTLLGTWAVEADFENAEAINEKRIQDLRAAELQERQLTLDLEKLMSGTGELIEVEEVLKRAIGRLVDLQDKVQALLIFFMSASRMVNMVIDQYEEDYLPKITNDVSPANAIEAAEELEEILDQAVRVKMHFATMQRISQAYVELSDRYIYGGFREIAELGLADTSLTEEGRKIKELQLRDYKSRASASVRETSARAQKELQSSLKMIAETSAGGVLIKRGIV